MTNRRTFLLGTGACLLLRPFDRFLRARAQEMPAPGVFIIAHKCQAAYPNNDPAKFIPEMRDGSMVLSPALASLAGYEDLTTVVAGATLANFEGGDWHHAACAHYHGSRFDGGFDRVEGVTPRGETVDQYIARAWGVDVRVTDIGRRPGNTPNKSSHFVSWKETDGAVRRQEPAIGLAATFRSLIGDAVLDSGMSMDEYERRAAQGQSLLDRYVNDVRRLQTELPSDVSAQLEGHVDGFRAFERATFQSSSRELVCEASGVREAWREEPGDESDQDWLFRRAKLQAEMIAFSAACGLHRVFTYGFVDDDSSFMIPSAWQADQKPVAYRGDDEGSRLVEHPAGRPSRFEPNGCEPNDNYHFGHWHCNPRTANHEQLEDYIFRYSVGYLVRQLDARGVLDKSLVLYGTSMSFDHSNEAHPYLLIGGADGRHRGGRVLRFGDRVGGSGRVSNNQVLATACQLFDLPVETYGEAEFGTGGIPGF